MRKTRQATVSTVREMGGGDDGISTGAVGSVSLKARKGKGRRPVKRQHKGPSRNKTNLQHAIPPSLSSALCRSTSRMAFAFGHDSDGKIRVSVLRFSGVALSHVPQLRKSIKGPSSCRDDTPVVVVVLK